GATGTHPGTGVHGIAHDRVDRLQLSLVDDRAQVDVVGERVADPQRVGLRGQLRHVLVVDVAVDDVATGRHADLALVQERSEGPGGGGAVEVRTGQHDQRVVAAELEVSALEQARRGLPDPASGCGGTGERDDGDLRCGDHGLPDVGATGEHVEHTL